MNVLKSAALAAAVVTLCASSFAEPSIAVTEFTSEVHTLLRHGLPETITENLVNSGAFEVFERDKLETVMKEQSFQVSGFVDAQSAASLGKMIGVQYILTGNIVEFGKERRNFRGYGVSTHTTFYRLKVGVKVIEVETGRIVYSKTGDAERKVVEGQGIRVDDDTIDTQLATEVADDVVAGLLRSPEFREEKKSEGPSLATITILSNPENADVEVDGVYYGNAGGEMQIESGLHTVVVSLPGYEIWSKKVMVRDGLSFNVTLMEAVDEKVSIEVK